MSGPDTLDSVFYRAPRCRSGQRLANLFKVIGRCGQRIDCSVEHMIWSDAVSQAEAIRQGEVSALDLMEEYIQQIGRLDPVLHAYVAIDAEAAIESARQVDRLLRTRAAEVMAPFLGVPLSVKDVVDIGGIVTSHSSKALAENVASADDSIVRRWKQAGFIILGKSNVPEFCTSMTSSELNGICRNPWDTERTPGGSSGGAAAALAAGMCAVSHGTDGAGSIRVPASFCGLVGMKPTRGLVTFGPEEGNQYFGTSVHGALTRSVRDAAAVLDVLVGTDDQGPRWLRIPCKTTSPASVRRSDLSASPSPYAAVRCGGRPVRRCVYRGRADPR